MRDKLKRETLDGVINLRLPGWLKAAIEARAKERRDRGESTTAADVAREILWPHFKDARPLETVALAHEEVVA